MLEIKDLRASIQGNEILKGLTLTLNPGECHALMGPNGSGKSTLAKVLAGHPDYEVTGGEVLLNGENVLEWEPDERAQNGIFLAFQYPAEVPGVTISNFLRTAMNARRKAQGKPELDALAFYKVLKEKMEMLGVDIKFAPPLRQRRLLRRRKEARRDAADGDAGAALRRPRRDRLRPRHRRAQDRRRGREQQRKAPPTWACWSSRTTSAC
jgi:ABC-type sugar transport system ATPase subunit